VVGCGSIGQRHIRNLLRLGVYQIAACDSQKDQLLKVAELYKVKRLYSNFESALNRNVDAVLICTPSASHASFVKAALEKNYHVFVEKPLSDTLVTLDDIVAKAKHKNKILMVGYNFRFHPCLKLIKQFLVEGTIGEIISAKAQFGQYLPDWRTNVDYRQSYSAKKASGGGIILDAIHEIDYMRWFLGEVAEVFCFAEKLSKLEIDTEDTAEILLRFKSKALGNIHMDYVQRVYNRQCEIIGEEGTLTWNFNDNIVRLYNIREKNWQLFPIMDNGSKYDFNQTYYNEIFYFLRCVCGYGTPPVDGAEGKKVQEIAFAAKRSAETGMVVKI
jgi:predicted dehydrogenase